MSELKLQITSHAEPVSVNWSEPNAGFFHTTLSSGESLSGKLLWISEKNGLLILNSEKNASTQNGRVFLFYRIQENLTTTLIWVDGQTFTINRPTREPQRAGHKASGHAEGFDGQLRAPLPGRVLRVLVQAGDTVEAGTPLVILESMKMETTLTSPIAAQVEEILINPNDLVDKGIVLIRLKAQAS
jgi:biotin carboxyl carrier protein